jgi:hypothetical protein
MNEVLPYEVLAHILLPLICSYIYYESRILNIVERFFKNERLDFKCLILATKKNDFIRNDNTGSFDNIPVMAPPIRKDMSLLDPIMFRVMLVLATIRGYLAHGSGRWNGWIFFELLLCPVFRCSLSEKACVLTVSM